MNVSKLDDVVKNDMTSVERIDQKIPASQGLTETEVSIDLSFWKVNLRACYKRVTGKLS